MLGLICLGSQAFARGPDVYVHGYQRQDGSYVQPYYRTAPDQYINNNYGTQGNYNPYTGMMGTVPANPYEAVQPTYFVPDDDDDMMVPPPMMGFDD